MTELIQYCHEGDFDTTTHTCSAPYWGPSPNSGVLPPLPIADAQAIGLAFGLLWATAYAFKPLKRLIDKS